MKFFRWFLLFLFLAAVFVHTVHIRKNTFDRFPGPGDNLWRNLHADALVATRNWFDNGPLMSGLAPNLAVPVLGNLNLNAPAYLSYPILFVAIPWAVAKISGSDPSLRLLMQLSLVAAFLSAIFLSFFLYHLLRLAGLERASAWILALVGGALFLELPGSILFFQNTWWADVAVLPFFILLLALEIAADRGRPCPKFIVAAVVALGLFSDWYFLCLVISLVAWRVLARKKIGRELIWPTLAFFAFHLALVTYHKGWEHFLTKISQRTGADPNLASPIFGLSTWIRTVEEVGGNFGLLVYSFSWLLLPLLIYFVIQGKKNPLLKYSFLILAATHLHFMVVRQHYYEHAYEALKLSFLFSALPFVFLPAWILLRFPRWKLLVLGILFISIALYARTFPPLYAAKLANAISMDASVQARAEALRPEIGPKDVLFSPDFASREVLRSYSEGELAAVHEWSQRLSHREILLAKSPAEIPAIAQAGGWEIDSDLRLRLIYAGTLDPIWREVVVEGTEVKAGDLTLIDLNAAKLHQ